MSAQHVFKPGHWHGNNARNSIADFPVRKFPLDRDFCNIDFLVNYTGAGHYKQIQQNITWVDGDCDQKFVMELSDHSLSHLPLNIKDSALKEYLDIAINNPNAIMIVSNITEPCSLTNMKALGYLLQNMDSKDFTNRVLCLVPDQDSIYIYREYLAQVHNYYDNLHIKDYAGHLVNYSGLKKTDSKRQTSYSEPRRVSLLNGQHKAFRLYICYKLWQAGLLDKMQVTYWNKSGYGNPRNIPLSELKEDLEMIEKKCTSYSDIDPDFDAWLETLPAQGGVVDSAYHATPEGKDFPWCLNESPIHVIPETLFDKGTMTDFNDTENKSAGVFITEKIYRALATGKAFIPMAQVGTLDKLHSMGFKTFERWWPEYNVEILTDNSIMTSEGPKNVNGSYQRYENLVKIVSDLYNKTDAEFQTMLTEMKPTLLHNQNRMQELIDHQERNRKGVFTKIFNMVINNE